jgi:hypothetical protein
MNSSSRPKWQGLVAAAAIVLAASGARAAAVPFTTSLVLQIATLPPVVIPGAGTVIVNGSAGGSHIHSLAFAGSTFATSGLVLSITNPSVFPIAGVHITAHNGAGNFADGGGTLGGVMPIAGVAKVCLFGPCTAAVSNLSVPLSVVGQGGWANPTGAVNLTVIGAPWTTGTAAVGTITAMGSAHGPASATSSTFLPGGQLKLVTPVFINTAIGASPVVPAFGILTFHFVPEPATIALLAGGIGLLGIIGRARHG